MDGLFEKRLVVDHTRVSGAGLAGLPLLVSFKDEDLKDKAHGGRVAQPAGGDIRFTGADGETKLDHELETYDPAEGALRAWVRVGALSGSADTELYLRCGDPDCESQQNPNGVWDADYRLVIHDAASPEDATANPAGAASEEATDGQRWTRVAHAEKLNVRDVITVEAWVESGEARAEAMQSVVSKWTPRTRFDLFDAYDAGNTDGLETKGFFGAVFDGRYIFFSPQHNREGRHGQALRYDTHGAFKDPASWAGYDASHTDGLNTKGYYGAVDAGDYIYYIPRTDGEVMHSRFLRYDRRGDFRSPESWNAYDIGHPISYQSAAFDGRYIYLVPGSEQAGGGSGKVVRYDTQGEFKDPASYTTYDAANTSGLDTRSYDGAVFDGRYVYFSPLDADGVVLRYDTEGDFEDAGSWVAYGAKKASLKRCVGAVFDGRHVYIVPYGQSDQAVRYDTAGAFTDEDSWEVYHLPKTSGLDTLGFDGAFFDGRYVYYNPYWDETSDADETFHGVVVRYDTQGAFTDSESWDCVDAGLTDGLKTVGFNGGATDGRFLYFGAWMDSRDETGKILGHGRVLRYDGVGDQGMFSLRYCDLGHNGGLCAALPGARFLVNTEGGPISIAANRRPEPGRHHLAGVYDGETIRLYIDGELVNEQAGSGAIVNNEEEIAIGRILTGLGGFRGRINEVRISGCARSGSWIRTQYNNQSDPASFCRIVP